MRSPRPVPAVVLPGSGKPRNGCAVLHMCFGPSRSHWRCHGLGSGARVLDAPGLADRRDGVASGATSRMEVHHHEAKE